MSALTNAVKLHGTVPTFLNIVMFFLQSGRNIVRWPLSQVLGLSLDLEGPVLGLDSCGLVCT